MDTTRRSWMKRLFGSAVALTVPVTAAPHVIRATDPGAELIEVYHTGTGETIGLVQAVCVKEGWVDVIRVVDGRVCCDHRTGEIVTARVSGPWATRPAQWRDHKQYDVYWV